MRGLRVPGRSTPGPGLPVTVVAVGDGKSDLLCRHLTRGDVRMRLMNGTVNLSETRLATVPEVGYPVVK